MDPEIGAGIWAAGVAGLETYSAKDKELEASSEGENGFIADAGVTRAGSTVATGPETAAG